MYQHKMEKDIRCPLEYGLEVFGGKWKSRVICVLAEKKILRYSEIRKEMTNITDAVLATTLKELIAYGIVNRKQYDEIPPRVEYSIMGPLSRPRSKILRVAVSRIILSSEASKVKLVGNLVA